MKVVNIFTVMVLALIFIESRAAFTFGNDGRCNCNVGETCCSGNTCCPQGYPICCPNNKCCKASHPVCCPTGCCAEDYPICCGNYCCKSGATCCGTDTCCSPEDIDGTLGILMAKGAGTNMHKPADVSVGLLSGPCNSYDVEIQNEGYHHKVYQDMKNSPKIGVGFNLAKAGAKEKIAKVGANYNAILNGTQYLIAAQIEALFNMDMTEAVECAEKWLPNWSSLGVAPQSAIADFALAHGCGRLHEFTHLKSALSKSLPDFKWAAEELKNSKWCNDVQPSRCARDQSCILA